MTDLTCAISTFCLSYARSSQSTVSMADLRRASEVQHGVHNLWESFLTMWVWLVDVGHGKVYSR